ncbi:MAG: hypothetical protein IJ144_00990 [Prevotella sp.]|nr:hypothetical protein [Prevotella sp.]
MSLFIFIATKIRINFETASKNAHESTKKFKKPLIFAVLQPTMAQGTGILRGELSSGGKHGA